MTGLPGRPAKLLLEIDLTHVPVDLDPGRHARPASRAQRPSAASDPARAARGRQGPARRRARRAARRHPAVGGDAGAAPRCRGVRQAEDRVGRELRRGVGRHDRLRARHGVRRDLAAARRRAGPARRRRPRRRSCAACSTSSASNRSSSSATSTRTPPTESCAPNSPTRTARHPTGSCSRSSTTPSRRSPPAAASTVARVRELVDTGPRTAVEAREVGPGRSARLPRPGLRSRPGARRKRRRAVVRRPVAPAHASPSCRGGTRVTWRSSARTERSSPDARAAA